MFGGADPQIPNLVPADIEIRANYFFKPLTWKVGDPSYLGHHWAIKNLLELKNARRVTIEGNVFENNWVDAQSGIPVVFTARNQDGNAPWCVVEDVLFTNNTVTNTQGGVNILRTSAESNGAITSHITISNNVFDKIGVFNAFILLNNPDYIQIFHNTVFKDWSAATLDANPGTPKGSGLVIRDNLFSEGGYGFFGSGIGEGTAALEGFYSSYVFTKNNVAGRDGSLYPGGNSFVLTPQVGFVDYAGGNYRLTSSSVFKNAATDGKDVGANIDALLAAQNSTTPAPTPMPTPTPEQNAFIQFNSASYSVNEDAGSVTIAVTRTGNTAVSASVSYSSLDVTALSGSDYNAVSGTLTFAAGESSKSFTVSIIDDVVVEGNETFNLILSDVSNAQLGSPSTAAVTIVDDDRTRRRIKPPRGTFSDQRLLKKLSRIQANLDE